MEHYFIASARFLFWFLTPVPLHTLSNNSWTIFKRWKNCYTVHSSSLNFVIQLSMPTYMIRIVFQIFFLQCVHLGVWENPRTKVLMHSSVYRAERWLLFFWHRLKNGITVPRSSSWDFFWGGGVGGGVGLFHVREKIIVAWIRIAQLFVPDPDPNITVGCQQRIYCTNFP